MYFDSRMNDKIPIFPLPLVLLPGEKLPLHIFEEKYRKMIEHCLKNLAKFKVPHSIVFVDLLPRNATGKVLKRELREEVVGSAAPAIT